MPELSKDTKIKRQENLIANLRGQLQMQSDLASAANDKEMRHAEEVAHILSRLQIAQRAIGELAQHDLTKGNQNSYHRKVNRVRAEIQSATYLTEALPRFANGVLTTAPNWQQEEPCQS